MSSVARAVCDASDFTSCATTAKPRPASPARAASIVAFSASRLVCPAMSRISPRMLSIDLACSDKAWLIPTASPACTLARLAISAAASTSVRASSIARISPADVCAASRIATADCSAAAATSDALPSTPRAEADDCDACRRSEPPSWLALSTVAAIFSRNSSASRSRSARSEKRQ